MQFRQAYLEGWNAAFAKLAGDPLSIFTDPTERYLAGKEGFKTQVYDDATGKPVPPGGAYKGYPTVGIGHKLTNSTADQAILQRGSMAPDEAVGMFRQDIQAHQKPWMDKLKPGTQLSQQQMMAMTDTAFNAGAHSMDGIVAKINAGDMKGASDVMRQHRTMVKNNETGKLEPHAVNTARRQEAANMFHPESAAQAGVPPAGGGGGQARAARPLPTSVTASAGAGISGGVSGARSAMGSWAAPPTKLRQPSFSPGSISTSSIEPRGGGAPSLASSIKITGGSSASGLGRPGRLSGGSKGSSGSSGSAGATG